MKKTHSTLFGNLLLLITALIWGSSFVSQRVSMKHIDPFTFLASRSFLAVIFLIAIILIKSKFTLPSLETSSNNDDNPRAYSLWKGGTICGFFMFLGASIQQVGMVHTTASKAGFITAIYVIFVPIIGIFLKHKIKKQVWFSVILVSIGLYLLCVTESFSINNSDLLVLIGSVFWSFQILVVDYYSPHVDCVKLSCIQFTVCLVLSTIVAFIVETPELTGILACGRHIVYAGIFASGVGFTLQMIGQKFAKAAIASIIMSMESVFAALSGVLLIGEILSIREICGSLLVLSAIIIAQVSIPSLKTIRTTHLGKQYKK